jgi:hypothetical protein
MQAKLSDLLAEVQTLRATSKVNEERAKYIEGERTMIE